MTLSLDGHQMHSALRSLTLTLGATSLLAACGNNSKSVGDVLAEDTTLAREVMSARGDSLGQPVETTIPEPSTEVATLPAPASVTESPARVADTPIAARSTRSAIKRTTPRQSTSRKTRNSSHVVEGRINDVITPSREAQPRSSQRRTIETTPMRSSANIPAGIELALNADQRVCASMTRIGDTFTAHIAEDVVGPIGVVIPKGATARARVVANKGDVDIDVEQISLGDHEYSINSLVTYTEIEKVGYKSSTARNATAGAGLGAVIGGVAGRDVKTAVIGAAGGAVAGILASRSTTSTRRDKCIPNGGDITARLVQPLKIALAD